MNTFGTKATIGCMVILLGCSISLFARPAGDTIEVWVDDAHSRKVTVSKVDPDEIADPMSFKIGFGVGYGKYGISVSWAYKRGIDFDPRMQELIERIHELCEEFNDGKLSLEAYQRRMREIYATIETAKRCRAEMLVNLTMESRKALSKMDEAFGNPVQDLDALKAELDAALALFDGSVGDLPVAVELPDVVGEDDPEVGTAGEDFERELAGSRRAVETSWSDLVRSMDRPPGNRGRSSEKITIWKDRAKTERITVHKLDMEDLVDDLEESLSVQYKYSNILFSVYVGERQTWVLRKAQKYNEAAQLLILKYKKLCLEYNAGLVSQEEYGERLEELFEAERRAFFTREIFAETLKSRAEERLAEMDAWLADVGGAELPEYAEELAALADAKKEKMKKDKVEKFVESGQSLVDRMSRGHAEQMAADELERFEKGVQAVEIAPSGDVVEVWVDDARTRKVKVPRLDTDLLAMNTESRLGLHLAYFDFGPEFEYGRKRGIAYKQISQHLIIKYKQLCMNYNAGVVTQESFERIRLAIDTSVENAARAREHMVGFLRAMKKSALGDLQRRLEHLRKKKKDRLEGDGK